MNSFGNIFRLTSFGESHGPAVGGVIDGVPARVVIDLDEFRRYVARRRPGRPGVSPRSEADRVELLSGVMGCDCNGEITGAAGDAARMVVTLGTPIGFMVRNTDMRPGDYDALRRVYRPSHADYTWEKKYGLRDWRGGGRSSGRETLSRVVAGAIAAQILKPLGVSVSARLVAVGDEADPARFQSVLAEVAAARDSVGGVVECVASGVPAGWGEPVFGKLQQMLAGAMLSIGGVKGFEYGGGFAMARMHGSEANDCMCVDDGVMKFTSNNSGGIQGGISNGCDIVMRVAFKPTPTIGLPQRTVGADGRELLFSATGRHDPCIAVRGAVVVEAMAAMVLCDAMLMSPTL